MILGKMTDFYPFLHPYHTDFAFFIALSRQYFKQRQPATLQIVFCLLQVFAQLEPVLRGYILSFSYKVAVFLPQ